MARELRGRRVVVAGLGRSGVAAAKLLVREGAKVTATDLRSARMLGDVVPQLQALGVTLELEGHRRATFADADLVVKSPGIKPSVPELVLAKESGIEVIGEVELCVPWLDAPVIAITGTNGKSTTTALAGHLLEAAGLEPFVGGNLGTPVAEYVLSGRKAKALVLELSSYQLDDLVDFRCDVACVTNLTPDHLERYGSMEAYAASKERLLSLLKPDGLAVLNASDDWTRSMGVRCESKVAWFGHGPAAEGAIRTRDGHLFDAFSEGGGEYVVGSPALRGVHNLENAMAAIIAVRRLGATPEAVQRGLDSYPGLPHRIERVRVLDGVEWVNDSKATNVDSVEKSLAAFKGPLHLILGGRGKGTPYLPLRSLLPGRVARLYLIGEEAGRLALELGDLAPVERAGDLETAVLLARGFARPGETVLLSPACASFDQFTSFEHRGEVFRSLVERLSEGA